MIYEDDDLKEYGISNLLIFEASQRKSGALNLQ